MVSERKSPFISNKPSYKIPSYLNKKDELVQLTEKIDKEIEVLKKGLRWK